MDKKKIKEQAKEILDKFASALDKAKIKEETSYVDREEFEREEGEGRECKDFKERMLENAPRKSGDFVIAEKKDW